MMKHGRTPVLSILAVALLTLLPAVTGCDDEEDYRDHEPPAGMGSLIVDNNSPEDIDIYLDAALDSRVKDGDDRIIDLAPGDYRVVLDSDDSDRLYSATMDILEGRLTILHVSIAISVATLNVRVEID